MQIFVQIGPRRTLPLDVEAEDTISSVKAQLAALEDVPLRLWRLIHGDDPRLEDRKTLLEYGIIQGTIIHAVTEPPLKEFLRMAPRATKRRKLIDRLRDVHEQMHRLQLESEEERESSESEEFQPDASRVAAAPAVEPPLRQAEVEGNLEGQRPPRLRLRPLTP